MDIFAFMCKQYISCKRIPNTCDNVDGLPMVSYVYVGSKYKRECGWFAKTFVCVWIVNACVYVDGLLMVSCVWIVNTCVYVDGLFYGLR